MTWLNDNRWSPGASRAEVPDDAPAAYSARWIDQGPNFPADVVPDRQGVAYDERSNADRLLVLMSQHEPRMLARTVMPDTSAEVINADGLRVWMRRTGGYVYVDAWLT